MWIERPVSGFVWEGKNMKASDRVIQSLHQVEQTHTPEPVIGLFAEQFT